MSDLLGKIRRALRKPPGYIAARLWHEVASQSERYRASARAARLSSDALCRRLGAASFDGLWAACAARPYPFLHKMDPIRFEALCPGETDRILQDAARAARHEVDLLGSGPVQLGTQIDWLTDFKTGKRWPAQFCRNIEYANLGQPSDVKVPWELSRMQWLIPAAQAYLLTGDESHARTVRAVLESWIDANPYAWTVNWSCTMEAAMRILVFTWFFHALKDSQAFANPDFRGKFLKSLYLHGDFTLRHIERAHINGNHFTADAAALVFAELFFDGGTPWDGVGQVDLEREIPLQVFADGVDFEASIAYHRLVMELFLLPAIYLKAAGKGVSTAWNGRLAAMARFVAGYTQPDGLSPVWGDADDARSLPMCAGALRDHRYLLGLTADYFSDPSIAARFTGSVAEIAWIDGLDAAAALAGRPAAPARSQAFPEGGFFILASGNDHVVVDCGPLGLAGCGGHGHNDILSFESVLAGHRLIVDSGSLAYTGSVEDRNAFRSTAYHNTPQLDGAEINRFIRPDYLWTMHDDATPVVESWAAEPTATSLVVGHTGYQRLSDPVSLRRSFLLDHQAHALTIEDRFSAEASHRIDVPFHLAPEVSVSDEGAGAFLLQSGGQRFRLSFSGQGWTFAVQTSRFSPSYGVAQPSHRVVCHFEGKLSHALTARLAPVFC